MMKTTLTPTSTHRACSGGDTRPVWSAWSNRSRRRRLLSSSTPVTSKKFRKSRENCRRVKSRQPRPTWSH
ncbi:hypothetical protein DPMN_043863 [Dreissena polymorpha]|uniref:Uncharacterized protein n=1 Tax=Dreissena polymorpha TaxID=45954 RepID=A0A9D4D280_DREPO|nr:hypothetical protein DPMN_043863 [Dreissena polymorpha]